MAVLVYCGAVRRGRLYKTLDTPGSFVQGFFMNSKRELVTDPAEIKKEMAGFSDGWTLNILAEGGISTNLNGYQLTQTSHIKNTRQGLKNTAL